MLKKEMVKKGWKAMGMKMGIAAAAVIIGLTAVPGTAEAKMSNGSFVPIAGGAVDSITVNGVKVDALYEPYNSGTNTDTTYSCAAFVKRFYRDVYGRDVYGLNSTTSVPQIDQGSFTETNSPKVGDILRDNQSVHWAIVKEVNGNTVTLIQQNAWNGDYNKAWVGAKAELGDSRYSYFTWNGNNGNSGNKQQVYHDFSFNYHSLERYDTNAVIHTKVNNPERLHVKKVGCYIYDSNGSLIKRHEENCSRNESRFNIWYDFTGELGVTLTPGTEYSYQFYVIYDNVEYQGAKETFTTTGTASKAQDDTVEMSRECGPAPSLDYAKDGWLSLQELARSSEQALHDRMWDPEKEVGNKKCYAPERCGVFSTMAPVMAEMGNDRVDSITWKYTYPDKSYKAESKEFYEGVAEAGNEVLGMTGTGICENKNHMTTTWNGVASLQWSMEEGVPTITITVE